MLQAAAVDLTKTVKECINKWSGVVRQPTQAMMQFKPVRFASQEGQNAPLPKALMKSGSRRSAREFSGRDSPK